ncbi:MAG: hypothetical protein JWN56_1960 [Sphingobacteriales bacterium]|nr:hypothetical protein [Sphingobacteriales bacterium]
MRKLLLTTSLISVLTIAAFASNQKQILLSNKISLPYNAYFVADLNADKATLSKSKNFFVRLFIDEGLTKTAFYNLNKELIATTHVGTIEEMPTPALKAIGNGYKGYAIEEVIVYEGNVPELNGSSFSETEKIYFVNLVSEKESIILRVDTAGFVYFFKTL